VQTLQQQTPAALTIGQLLVFNGVRHKRTSVNNVSTAVRHAQGQETPLPLYVGLAVHAATRKKRLVNKLFDLGICVSYDRVLSLLNDLASGVCDRFKVENVVCPPHLQSNVFTVGAVDNIITTQPLQQQSSHFMAQLSHSCSTQHRKVLHVIQRSQ